MLLKVDVWTLKKNILAIHYQHSVIGVMSISVDILVWSSPPGFNGVRVTRSLVLCVCFEDRCLFFCTFSFDHCVFCSSLIYGF